MYLPPLNTTGVFKFLAPFNVPPFVDRILKVISIRSLEELKKDGADPLNNIYLKIKLSQSDYEDDLKNNVPIIVFKSKADSLYYIPANRIEGLPLVNGVPYVRRIITFNLGALPTALDLSRLESALKETAMEFIGIEPVTKISDGSEVTLISKDKHEQFMSKLSNTPYSRRNKPYRVRYQETLNRLNDLTMKYNALNTFMAKTWNNNVVDSKRPTPSDLELYTKKMVIDVVAPLTKKAGLNSLLIKRRNSFNLDPVPAYMRGMMSSIGNNNEYTAMLDKTRCSFKLTKGKVTEQLLPDMFSDLNYIELEKDPANNISRGSVEIVFEDIVNIRDMVVRPALSDDLLCSKIRISLYNKSNTMIYCVSFQLGTHYSVRDQQGLTQFLKINDMQLSTSIPQVTPPELEP